MLANLPSYQSQNQIERAHHDVKGKCNTSSFPVSKVFSKMTPVSETSTFTRYWLMIPFGCCGFFHVILICVASTSASCKSNIAPGAENNNRNRNKEKELEKYIFNF